MLVKLPSAMNCIQCYLTCLCRLRSIGKTRKSQCDTFSKWVLAKKQMKGFLSTYIFFMQVEIAKNKIENKMNFFV